MKTIHFFICLLFFAAGWSIRGLYLPNQQQIDASVADSSFKQESSQARVSTVGHGSVGHGSVGHSPAGDPYILDSNQLDANPTIELVESLTLLVDTNRVSDALEVVRNLNFIPSEKEVELLGRLITAYSLSRGIDQYLNFHELKQLESEIAAMNLYASSAQFFDVIELASSEPFTALSKLKTLSSYYQEQVSDDQLFQLEVWLLAYVDRTMRGAQDWQGLETWYKALADWLENPSGSYLRLAQLYFENKQYVESLEALDRILNYQLWGSEEKALYARNMDTMGSSSVTSIPLQRVGEHYLVKIRINQRIDADMLLDTGASISGLGVNFIRSMNFKYSGETLSLATAGGQIDAGLVRLNLIDIGDKKISDLNVAGIDLGGQYDGLLGMDVLGRFEFYLDQRDAILYLRPFGASSPSLTGFQ